MEGQRLIKLTLNGDFLVNAIKQIWDYYVLRLESWLPISLLFPPIAVGNIAPTCDNSILKSLVDMVLNPSADWVFNSFLEFIHTYTLTPYAIYVVSVIILTIFVLCCSYLLDGEDNISDNDDKSILNPSANLPLLKNVETSDDVIKSPVSTSPALSRTVKKITPSISMESPPPNRPAQVLTTGTTNLIELQSQVLPASACRKLISPPTSIPSCLPSQRKSCPIPGSTSSQGITQTKADNLGSPSSPSAGSPLSPTDVPDGPTPPFPRKKNITRQVKDTTCLEAKTEIASTDVDKKASNSAIHHLLTGIRVLVSQTNKNMDQELIKRDYTSKNTLVLDTSGNQVNKRRKYDFKFNDYSPLVFHHLRQLFKVNSEDYLKSLISTTVESELKSPGKSGSSFYFSSDYRFIIKTIHYTERETLVQNLKHYYHHVKRNPDTLISQFYGLHSVKRSFGKEVNFIVMNNLFPASREIHRTFDLKGSTLGRRFIDGPSATNKKSVVYKDLDWIDQGEALKFGPLKRRQFLEQLKKDTKLLQQLNIMDYSLLIGIHKTAAESKPKSTVAFRDDLGGFRSTDENDKCLADVYYLGIIDCLTRYSSTKKAETVIKCMKHDRKAISSISASNYGSRFYLFIESAITDVAPQEQATAKNKLDSTSQSCTDNYTDKKRQIVITQNESLTPIKRRQNYKDNKFPACSPSESSRITSSTFSKSEDASSTSSIQCKSAVLNTEKSIPNSTNIWCLPEVPRMPAIPKKMKPRARELMLTNIQNTTRQQRISSSPLSEPNDILDRVLSAVDDTITGGIRNSSQFPANELAIESPTMSESTSHPCPGSWLTSSIPESTMENQSVPNSMNAISFEKNGPLVPPGTPRPNSQRLCLLNTAVIQEKEPSTFSLLHSPISADSGHNEMKGTFNPTGVEPYSKPNQVSHIPSKMRRCGNYYRKRSLWLENASLLPEQMASSSDRKSELSLRRSEENLKPPEYFQDRVKGGAGIPCFESFSDKDFKAIRTLLKINNDHFKYGFHGCLREPNIPPNGPVYSSSGRFVLRSFNHQQAYFLHRHVSQFKNHLHSHPNTALSKFIALYSVGPFFYAIEYLTQEEIRYKPSRYLMKWNGEFYDGYCLSKIDATEAKEYKSILLQDIQFFEKIKAQFYNLQGGEKEDGSSWFKFVDWVTIISDDGVKVKKNLQIHKSELEFLFE